MKVLFIELQQCRQQPYAIHDVFRTSISISFEFEHLHRFSSQLFVKWKRNEVQSTQTKTNFLRIRTAFGPILAILLLKRTHQI